MGACGWTGIALAVLAAGCGSAATATHAGTAKPSSVAATSPSHVSNPFSIVARYSASSLGLKNLRDIAIGPNGIVYITDATDRVTEMSPNGKVVRRWGGRGEGLGEFNFVNKDARDPNDVAASITVGPNGDVYVSDSGNARVEVFSPTGRFVRQFGSSITSPTGHFLLPFDLVVGSNRDVYVNDQQQSVIEKYSPTGAFVWQVGSGAGSTDPDLSSIQALVSIDRHGLMVTASDSGEAVTYLDPQGRKVDIFRTTAYLSRGVGPCDVSLDSLGDAFVQSCPGPFSVGEPASPPIQTALVFDRAHNLIGAWYHAPFARSPRFGPNGEVFALGFLRGGYCFRCKPNAIFKLKVALP